MMADACRALGVRLSLLIERAHAGGDCTITAPPSSCRGKLVVIQGACNPNSSCLA